MCPVPGDPGGTCRAGSFAPKFGGGGRHAARVDSFLRGFPSLVGDPGRTNFPSQKNFSKIANWGLHFLKECGIIIELSSEAANTSWC